MSLGSGLFPAWLLMDKEVCISCKHLLFHHAIMKPQGCTKYTDNLICKCNQYMGSTLDIIEERYEQLKKKRRKHKKVLG